VKIPSRPQSLFLNALAATQNGASPIDTIT